MTFVNVKFGKSFNYFLVDLKGNVSQLSKLCMQHLAKDPSYTPILTYGKTVLDNTDNLELLQIGPESVVELKFKHQTKVDEKTMEVQYEYITE